MQYQELKMDEAKSKAQALGLVAIGDGRKRSSWVAALERSDRQQVMEQIVETAVEPIVKSVIKPAPVVVKQVNLSLMPALVVISAVIGVFLLFLSLVKVKGRISKLSFKAIQQVVEAVRVYASKRNQADRIRPEEFLKFQTE